MSFFRDRREAGSLLAASLRPYAGERPIVVALPRGGLPVAEEVAVALAAPLDVWVVRKLGAPDCPEFAIGAIAENGLYWLNEEAIDSVGATPEQIEAAIETCLAEVRRRAALYRDGRELIEVMERTVIVVDDGLATGATALVALRCLGEAGARRLVFASPVCAPGGAKLLRNLADEVACVHTPARFLAVGDWYEDFRQVSDDDVRAILKRARERHDREIAKRRAA